MSHTEICIEQHSLMGKLASFSVCSLGIYVRHISLPNTSCLEHPWLRNSPVWSTLRKPKKATRSAYWALLLMAPHIQRNEVFAAYRNQKHCKAYFTEHYLSVLKWELKCSMFFILEMLLNNNMRHICKLQENGMELVHPSLSQNDPVLPLKQSCFWNDLSAAHTDSPVWCQTFSGA